MRKHQVLRYALVYGMWLVVMAVGLWLLLVSRDVVLGAVARLLVDDSTAHTWQLVSVERFYMVGAGLLWLVMTVVSEAYLRRGVDRGGLLRRFARMLAPQLLLLFAVDAALFALQGLQGGPLRWLILIVELGLGIGSLIVARGAPGVWADMKASDA